MEPPPPTTPAANVPPLRSGWTEDEVTFTTAQGTIYGTLAQPVDPARTVPGALIIGGSGANDRNGNAPSLPAAIDTLRAVSHWLAADGVATLRYDKLGAGKTGRGNLTTETTAALTVDDYLAINGEALKLLAARPGIDATRLSIVGHSEGGLLAMLLATGRHGAATDVPPVHSIAALEPLAVPFLDIVAKQIRAQVAAAQVAGQYTQDQGDALLASLQAAIDAVRAGAPLPADLAAPLRSVFNASTVNYIRTEDAIDPRVVAAGLPSDMPFLLSCSDADLQIDCADVEAVADAATAAGTGATLVHLADVAHTLKVDTSRSIANYGADLPFSPQLQAALTAWITSSGRSDRS